MQKKLIMVVEDDKSVRETMCMVLESSGFSCHAVENAYEAIEDMAHVKPDAIVLDYVLSDNQNPPLTPADVVETARKLDAKMPIILVTAASKAEEIADFLKVDKLVKKPFAIEELVSAIEGFVKLDNGSTLAS